MKKYVKKISMVFILAFIIALSFQSLEAFAWIGDRYDSEDSAFVSIMQEMKADQGYDYDEYTYTKAALYNTDNEISGYVYDFTLDNQRDGFVLMVKLEDEWFEVTEIFVDVKSKYYENPGINIYPKLLSYISSVDGVYYELTLQQEITLEDVLSLEAQGFGFSVLYPDSTQWNETVYYSTRTVTNNQISYKIPAYTAPSTLGENSCANIAGTVVVGYWDAFKPNLIPSYSPVNIYNGVYYWKSGSTETTNVTDELYVRMGTNSQGPGTTISQFKTGLTSYASAFGGYSTSYTSTMTSGSYDISKMLTAFSNNRPVVLFMSPEFNFVSSISTQTGYDYIVQSDFDAAHTMIAYGRQINKYYNSSNVIIREITFLKVAGCMSGAGLGWVRLNEGSLSINDSFSIQIS